MRSAPTPQTAAVEQGGSTITQQLVKILFTGRERSLTRKIKEALFAYELETKNDKDEVLETYLNTVYFGRGAYGVESASQRYFGKSASSLDLAESATLAGIIRSPSRYGSSDPRSAATLDAPQRRAGADAASRATSARRKSARRANSRSRSHRAGKPGRWHRTSSST